MSQKKQHGLSPKCQIRNLSISTKSLPQLLIKNWHSQLNFVLWSRALIAATMLHNANQRPHFPQKNMNYCSSQVPLQVPNVHSLSFSVCLSLWPSKCTLSLSLSLSLCCCYCRKTADLRHQGHERQVWWICSLSPLIFLLSLLAAFFTKAVFLKKKCIHSGEANLNQKIWSVSKSNLPLTTETPGRLSHRSNTMLDCLKTPQ